ncbi:butyrophilin subfamily 1 member A1-like [Symphorus nematophorus]
MGSVTFPIYLVAAIGLLLCGAAPVPDSLVVLVRSSVSVQRGQTTTLPCWLNPPQSAEALEVRWYRNNQFDLPIMLYRARKFEHESQEHSYTGRVSFGSKDAASGGLTAGDVSLQLGNTTLEDAGDYTCYVSSDQGYDSARVTLTVTETGTFPLLTAAWKESNRVNVSCESEGWYPEPNLHWSDHKQVLTSKNQKSSKDSSGLLSIHSWLLVPSSSEISCSVGLSGGETMVARVRLENSPQPDKQEQQKNIKFLCLWSGSSSGGWVAFGLLLVAILVLAVLGVLCFKKKVKEAKSESDRAEENLKLLSEEKPTELSKAKEHYENVTLKETKSSYLKVAACKLRDANVDFPDGKKVTCLTAIKGTPGFSSGQHYWEVSMGDDTVGLKESWWIGITSAIHISEDIHFNPTASKGYWFLSSSPDRADHFQLSTEPKVLLSFRSRPKTVGVYLNYDSGELSFYDVEGNSHIVSFSAKFTGEVFPFFNPGKDDKSPMEIIQLGTGQGWSSDMVNSVNSTAPEAES